MSDVRIYITPRPTEILISIYQEGQVETVPYRISREKALHLAHDLIAAVREPVS